jgi:hypothetical protein
LHLSDGHQICFERFAKDIIAVVNGERPWADGKPGTAEGSMMYDVPMEAEQHLSRFVKSEAAEETGRRYILQTIARLFDRLMDSWQQFMAA